MSASNKNNRPTASRATVLDCISDYIEVATDPTYWDGIYRRLQATAPLTMGEVYSLNDLVRDWTQYYSFDYRTTVLI